ncbi:MAG TPA: DUF3237 domain-containing protein [Woeseiaceae bacterium]|nr:DUF3237 domain-containing protein [Woeseiaceae bacterium]
MSGEPMKAGQPGTRSSAEHGNALTLQRRELFKMGVAGLGMAATGIGFAGETSRDGGLRNYDPIRTELVMNLVVTCSTPETMGPNNNSKDGVREDFWPIVGGYFEGPSIKGDVMPGGADYPLVRPDGVVVIDAFYRLRTHDGTNILIHNKGLAYPGDGSGWGTYRLVPVFTAPQGPYDWLNKSVFLSTLVETPAPMAVAKGPDENDRLIQVHRVF